MTVTDVLLSGLVGAFTATLLLILYQSIADKIKERKYLIENVTDWVDGIYVSLQFLSSEKDLIYNKHLDALISNKECNAMNNKMRILLLSNKIKMQALCIYGEGDIVRIINRLQENLLKAARIFWKAREDTWSSSHDEILKLFTETIDPAREQLTQTFLSSLKDLSVRGILTTYILTTKNFFKKKKIRQK